MRDEAAGGPPHPVPWTGHSRSRTVGYFVHRDVRILFLHVDHHLERDHGYAQFFFVLAEHLLRVIRPVERRAAGIIARLDLRVMMM